MKFLITGGSCRFFGKQEENRMIKSDRGIILKLLKILCDFHYMTQVALYLIISKKTEKYVILSQNV